MGIIKRYSGRPEDQQKLEALCQEWTEQEFWPLGEFLISLKIPGTFLLALESEERWLGLALGRVVDANAELFYVYTSPAIRGQGAGWRLLKAFVGEARERYQAGRVFLEVRPSNMAAIRMYERFGFVATGRRKRYYQNGEDALVFEKALL